MNIGDVVKINKYDEYPDVVGHSGMIKDINLASGIGSLEIDLKSIESLDCDSVWVWMNGVTIIKLGPNSNCFPFEFWNE